MNIGDSVTIANGASLSGAIDTEQTTLGGIAIPAVWTAANITFAVSADGGLTYLPLYDANGAEVTAVVTAASTYIALDPALFAGVRFVKLRSGTNAVPVNQGTARILTLAGRRFE